MSYDDAKRELENAGASMRCSDVTSRLESLGFKVRDCKNGGHKVFNHPSMPSFHGGNFDCGHKRNSEVKKVYLRNILRVLDDFEADIKSYLGIDLND